MTEPTPGSTDNVDQSTQVTTDQSGNGQTTTHQETGSQAGSPSAAAEPKSMLDAVNAALDTTKAGASQAPKGPAVNAKEGEQSDGKNGSEEYDGTQDLSDEEKGRLSERTQRRMAHLSNEVKARSEEIEALKPDAEIGRLVTGYAHKAGLSSEEIDQTFQVAYAVKKDPERALQMLGPLVDQLRQIAGEVLPPELQQAVNEGRIAEDLARELSRNQAKAGLSTKQLQERDRQDSEAQAQEQHRTHVNTVSNAVRQYDLQWQKTDPDYALKKDRVLELVELDIRRNGFPKTAQDAVEGTKRARTQVEAELARLRPANVRPITPISGGGSSAQGKPAPKTMLDVIDSTLGR